jgi:TolB protein
MQTEPLPNPTGQKPRSNFSRVFFLSILLLLIVCVAAVYVMWRWPTIWNPAQTTPVGSQLSTSNPNTATPPTLLASTPVPTLAVQTNHNPSPPEGAFLFSMEDGQTSHLFLYQPGVLPLTRLFNSTWDDHDPAVSPDGSRLAFSSRRNGYWDLYIMNLSDGNLTRVTDTPEYEGSPTWSSDGLWLAYEKYGQDYLDIFINNLADPTAIPIRLTENAGFNHAPTWSPSGREIAFVSTRSSNQDIWLARLDRVDDRFINLSHTTGANEDQPAWAADGTHLAWVSDASGSKTIETFDTQNMDAVLYQVGVGDDPAWNSDSTQIVTRLRGPNQVDLTAYQAATGQLTIPFSTLRGDVHGLTWVHPETANLLLALAAGVDQNPPAAPFTAILTLAPGPSGRLGVVPLTDVNAPYAFLQDSSDEAFQALRIQVAQEAGWDFLANLENAYIPLTEPPIPGAPENWLYTGRAINIITVPVQAGWMAVTREDFSGQVYWRILLKCRYQDGSQGLPMTAPIWNFNTRFSGDPNAYEQGGSWSPPLTGYWLDFTAIAGRFGWQRQAALANWRSFYPATLYNQFVFSQGLDWNHAMREVYSIESLSTYTPVPTYTRTPTPTKEGTQTLVPTRTPSPTPSQTLTPTFRPTWTVQP